MLPIIETRNLGKLNLSWLLRYQRTRGSSSARSNKHFGYLLFKYVTAVVWDLEVDAGNGKHLDINRAFAITLSMPCSRTCAAIAGLTSYDEQNSTSNSRSDLTYSFECNEPRIGQVKSKVLITFRWGFAVLAAQFPQCLHL